MKATESAELLKARFGMMKEAAFVHWADSETPCPKGWQDGKKVTCQRKSLSQNWRPVRPTREDASPRMHFAAPQNHLGIPTGPLGRPSDPVQQLARGGSHCIVKGRPGARTPQGRRLHSGALPAAGRSLGPAAPPCPSPGRPAPATGVGRGAGGAGRRAPKWRGRAGRGRPGGDWLGRAGSSGPRTKERGGGRPPE